jgi:histidine triad (HIT) family protein
MNHDARVCPFCDIVELGVPDHVLHWDENAFILLDRDSLGFGHCMVVPRCHVRQLHELPPAEYVFELAKEIAPKLIRATGKQAVGFVAFGSGLPHAHLHVVPNDDPSDLLKPASESLTDAELAANAEHLRALFSIG